MRTIAKAAAAILLLLLLAAGAGLLALRRFFPPEKLRALALDRLERTLGREVRLARVGLGLRGIDVGGLEISEERGFKAGTFLKADAVRAGLRLRPLLRKRLELNEIVLSGWSCSVHKERGGAFNFASLAGGNGSAAKTSGKTLSAAPAGATVVIDRVTSKGGSLSYEDEASGTSLKAKDIDLELKGLRPEGTVPLSLSFSYSGRSGSARLEGKLKARGDVDLGLFAPEKLSLRLESLELTHSGLSLQASGEVANAKAPDASVRFSFPGHGGFPPAEGEARLKYPGEALRIERLTLRSKGAEVRLSGGVRLPPGKPPVLDLEAETKEFPLALLALLLPRLKEYGLQGSAGLKARLAGTASAPQVSGTATLKETALTAAGQKLSGIRASAKFDASSVEARASGRLNKGEFKAGLSLADWAAAPAVKLDGSLSELDLSALPESSGAVPAPDKSAGTGREEDGRRPAPAAKPLKTSGNLAVERILHPNFNASKTELHWDLSHALEPAWITGSAKLRVGEGNFDNLGSLAAKRPLLKTALLPILILQKVGGLRIPTLPSFDQARFKEITGSYAFKNGVMTVQESHLDSEVAHVAMSGTADLGRDQLNLRVSTKLAARLGLNVAGPIGFTVKGSLADPKVSLDAASILKQPAVQDALEQGRKLLDGLFK